MSKIRKNVAKMEQSVMDTSNMTDGRNQNRCYI